MQIVPKIQICYVNRNTLTYFLAEIALRWLSVSSLRYKFEAISGLKTFLKTLEEGRKYFQKRIG